MNIHTNQCPGAAEQDYFFTPVCLVCYWERTYSSIALFNCWIIIYCIVFMLFILPLPLSCLISLLIHLVILSNGEVQYCTVKWWGTVLYCSLTLPGRISFIIHLSHMYKYMYKAFAADNILKFNYHKYWKSLLILLLNTNIFYWQCFMRFNHTLP